MFYAEIVVPAIIMLLKNSSSMSEFDRKVYKDAGIPIEEDDGEKIAEETIDIHIPIHQIRFYRAEPVFGENLKAGTHIYLDSAGIAQDPTGRMIYTPLSVSEVSNMINSAKIDMIKNLKEIIHRESY